jgi:23S rRNA (uracil1939-C5)-methyltransferase
MMANIVETRIDNLVYGGDALGKLPDGRVIFMPYALPGELVKLRVVEDKPKFVRAELVEVLEPSGERTTPRCKHFYTCGGCHYQHIDYPAQLTAKKNILREQLERIGQLSDLPAIDVVPSPEPWNYRNTIQFHLTREGKLGFQKGRSNQTFAIQECHLPELGINRLWPQIEIEPIASVERVSLRQGVDEELLINLESDGTEGVDFSIEDLPVSVVQTWPSGSVVLAGSNYVTMEVMGRQFQVSAGAFFQVNSLQAKAIVSHLLLHLPMDDGDTVIDAYCGVGLFSAFLAPRVKRLVGIEVSSEACDDFTVNLDEFDNVELYEAPVEDVLASQHFHADMIVLDPPRAGLGPKTVEGVLSQGARHLAYISCDPATLARDSKQLVTGGYQLKNLTLFDMFPQTYHVETVVLMSRVKE